MHHQWYPKPPGGVGYLWEESHFEWFKQAAFYHVPWIELGLWLAAFVALTGICICMVLYEHKLLPKASTSPTEMRNLDEDLTESGGEKSEERLQEERDAALRHELMMSEMCSYRYGGFGGDMGMIGMGSHLGLGLGEDFDTEHTLRKRSAF